MEIGIIAVIVFEWILLLTFLLDEFYEHYLGVKISLELWNASLSYKFF